MATIGFVVWLVRLEGKVSYGEKGLSELKYKHDQLDSEIVKRIGLIEQTLARIEGRLDAFYGKKD